MLWKCVPPVLHLCWFLLLFWYTVLYSSSTTLCAVFAAHLPLSLCSHFHLGVFVKTAFMFSYSTKGLFHLFGPNEVSLLWHTVWNIFYSSLLSTALTLINRRKITVRKLSVQFLWKPFVNLEFFADFSSSGVFCINDYPVPHNPDVSGEGAVGGEPRSFYKWEILSLSLSIICIIGINSLQIDASRIFCFYIIQSYRYQIIEKIGIHIDGWNGRHSYCFLHWFSLS